MKIENLEIGMKIKYKKLCELLGIEPKEGNSRKKQFKEIDKLERVIAELMRAVYS